MVGSVTIRSRGFKKRPAPWWPWALASQSAGRVAESAIAAGALAGGGAPAGGGSIAGNGSIAGGGAPAGGGSSPSIGGEGRGKVEAEAPGRGAGRLRGLAPILLKVIILVHIFWIGTTSLLVFSYKYIDPSATVLMAWRKWADGWLIRPPRPVPLKAVPYWMRSMLISVEDHRFYEHHGFDFAAIRQAYEIDKRLGEPLYGGSTLTMQVARTLFLVPAKSYLRKYLEVIVTVELEAILGKDRILQLYFGYAEWGKGLFGVDATARRWFGRGVRDLTREEGARLVAILSSPIKYRPNWFGRSLILQERYDFLVRRYLPSLEPEPPALPSSLPPGIAAPPGEAPAGQGALPEGPLPGPDAQPQSEVSPAPPQSGASLLSPATSTASTLSPAPAAPIAPAALPAASTVSPSPTALPAASVPPGSSAPP